LLLYLSYGAVQFGTHEQVKPYLKSRYNGTRATDEGLRSFISGSVAGATATAVTYPFDVLRTRFTLQNHPRLYNSIPDACRKIYRLEGVRGFYGGVGLTMAQIFPYMGLMYLSYDLLVSLSKRGRRESPTYAALVPASLESLAIGGASGIFSKTAVFPADLMRKRLQVHAGEEAYVVGRIPSYRGALDCLLQILKQEGPSGFYKGLVPSLFKTAPASAVTFFVFENTKELLQTF